jgi:hypothetical protein
MGRHSRTLIVGMLVVATAAACGGSPGGGGGTPSPGVSVAVGESPSAAPTTSAPADPWVLSTAGIGPYHLGAHITDLTSAGLLGTSTPIDPAECPDLVSVAATGMYAGTLLLVVRHTVLVQIGTAGGGPVRSPEGVRVGDDLASATTLYGTLGTTHTGADGLPGLVVATGDRVLLFTGHPIRSGIGWFAAGYSDYTEATFVSGDDC